ncbi:hypothetical protein HPB48_015791 [Haemaphysalis longicornis]|uniref:PiggyBac transposable element-derived protein domain-containing protein n=1 Tax=Haemaphysalis longicornis TaxID=44386 RepID=A0A9J6GT91_HAELO|nr:hypothetical protein HPB48_015791 [Haemaphysalis longicornis]
MGGMELVDRYVCFYRTKIRIKNWTVRVFAHFLDLSGANSWIEYRNDCKLMDVDAKDMLPQFEFKNRIAETSIRTHVKEIPEVTGEAELEVENGESVAVPKRTKVTAIPPNKVRLDMHGQFQDHVPLKCQNRCRNQGRSGKTRIRCTKWHLFLCLLNRNCFVVFHSA